jgi:hypothetical protein
MTKLIAAFRSFANARKDMQLPLIWEFCRVLNNIMAIE